MSGVPWKPEPSTPSDGEPHDPLRVVAASHGRRQTEKVRLPKRARPRHWRRKSDEDLAHHLRALGCTTEQIERHLARGKMPPSPLPRLRRWIPTGGVPVRREGQASQPSILVHRSSRRMERSPDLPLYSGNRHDVLAFRVSDGVQALPESVRRVISHRFSAQAAGAARKRVECQNVQ